MKSVIYLALGDSISIDDYPDEEAKSEGNGAASLLAKKLAGQELISKFYNLTSDGATISNIYHLQLLPATKLINKNERVLITLTAGGNDVSFKSMRLRAQKNEQGFTNMMDEIRRDYVNLVIATRKMFPYSVIILNTLYDPTDGLGKLPESCGMWADIAELYSMGRRNLGNYIRRWGAVANPEFVVADIFKLFDRHGMATKNEAMMYYEAFLIEPGYTGAQKISELWYNLYTSHLAAEHGEIKSNDRGNQAAPERARVRQV